MIASNRSGFVLALVVVSAVLLASLVMTFHFVSASDYKAMARLERSVQASLLADLASDEVSSTVAAIKYGPGDTKPPWVTKMLEELAEARKNGAQPPFKVNSGVTFSMQDLTQTRIAAGRTGELVSVTAVEGKLGPFNLTSPGGIGALVYSDKAFGDAAKDPRAWDLRGPLAIKITVAGAKSAFEFSQDYQRGQELMITDTTAPAWEFALFSFLPPPNEAYMLNDLQSGATLNVDTKANAGATAHARLFFRGPGLILQEEPPVKNDAKPHLATLPGKAPQNLDGRPPPSYPDGAYKQLLAMVPGPTMMIHPSGTQGIFDGSMGGISSVFADPVGGFAPARPEQENSISKLVTKNFTFNITVDAPILGVVTLPVSVPQINWTINGASLALSNKYGTDEATFSTLDRDGISTFPPGAYLHAPLGQKKQKFRIVSPPNTTDGKCYKGVKLSPGADPAPWDGTLTAEGQAVTLEPVARPNQPLSANAGMLSLHGIARVESKTLLALPIKQFTLWMMERYIDTLTGLKAPLRPTAEANKENAAIQTLVQLGLEQTLTFIIRRFRTLTSTSFTTAHTDFTEQSVKNRLTGKEAVLAPFGAWFWDGTIYQQSQLLAKAKASLKTALLSGSAAEQALRDLLPTSNTPNFNANADKYERWDPFPTETTVSSEMRDWICGERQRTLLELILTGATTAGDAFDKLIALARPAPPRGIGPLELSAGNKRPKGVTGDFLAPPGAPPNSQNLERDYPTGYFPPKYREWERIITRRYPDMASYINAEKNANNELELRGAVLVEKMRHTQGLTYRGRGIIVCGTPDDTAANQSILDGNIGRPAGDTTSLLIIVHRTTPELLATGTAPPLMLGTNVNAAVYSDSGVCGNLGTTTITGNLVTGLLNKNKQTRELNVVYDKPLLDAPADKINERWTIEMSGEVTSTQP